MHWWEDWLMWSKFIDRTSRRECRLYTQRQIHILGDGGDKIISREWGGLGRAPRFLLPTRFLCSSSLRPHFLGYTANPTYPVPVTALRYLHSSIGCQHWMFARENSMGLSLQSHCETFNTKWFLFFSQRCLTFLNCSSQKQSDPESISLENLRSSFSKWTKCMRGILAIKQPAKPHKTGRLLLVFL